MTRDPEPVHEQVEETPEERDARIRAEREARRIRRHQQRVRKGPVASGVVLRGVDVNLDRAPER